LQRAWRTEKQGETAAASPFPGRRRFPLLFGAPCPLQKLISVI